MIRLSRKRANETPHVCHGIWDPEYRLRGDRDVWRCGHRCPAGYPASRGKQAAKDNGQEVQQDPVQKLLAADPKVRLIGNISTGSGVVVTLVLLISGVALLLIKALGAHAQHRLCRVRHSQQNRFQRLEFLVHSVRPRGTRRCPPEIPPGKKLQGIFAFGFGCSLIFGLVYPTRFADLHVSHHSHRSFWESFGS
ncbi:MAG: hypothetical protein CM1200mP2_37000 [Planctomycetaceae bacterium]|nr:MAG: hypothetical protein CM1200mP2_37000 [Planctomycetaceae bacterium]